MQKLSRPKKLDVSVILTGYNEEPGVYENLVRVRDLLNISRYSWELILYDDKSSDNTLYIFKEFAKKNKNVKVFFHTKNVGRGGTVLDAAKHTRGRFIGYIDTDLELSPVYIFEFIDKLEKGADVAIATRFYTVSAQNLIRTMMSKGYIFLMRYLLGLEFKDTEAGFKFFRKDKILSIFKEVKDKRWFFDTEVVARSYWKGLKIVEIPLVYIHNPQKISSVKLVADTTDYARKLWRFRREISKSRANRNFDA